ncbi:MAG: exodeoxyribonuclease VII small subunit [Bacteroidia bacterium]|jgi:exodeoxyribonuclease VII small subunit
MSNAKKNETPNYEDAFNELQDLVAQIEEGDISVDDLSEKVKRAALLIKICKTKLKTTEEDVNLILKQVQDDK